MLGYRNSHNYPFQTFANYNVNLGNTTPVGAYESGVSPYGAYDMTGNVEEWVADGAVRIGVGKFNSPEDIDRAAEMMGAALRAEPVKRIA